jgi:hypothetical protein
MITQYEVNTKCIYILHTEYFKCWNCSRIVIQSQFTQLKQHFFTFPVNCPHTFRLHLSDFKSLGMKSRLYARYSDTPTIIAVTRLLYGRLWCIGTKWLTFRLSEEVSLWSQVPNWCTCWRSCLTGVMFTIPRILCWKHTFPENWLWQMHEHSERIYYSLIS